jgi:hypothetical protein
MMRAPTSAIRGLVGIFALAASLSAQIVVTGKVVDENGAPVSNAVITIGKTAAASEPTGEFRLELPSSGEYPVRAEHEGFFVFLAAALSIVAESPLEIRLSHIKELAESIDVNYSPPVIDLQQTSDSKQIDSQEILNLPIQNSQDYRSALPLMPGIVTDNAGQLHFNGGASSETSYRLNGFEVSDPATGALTTRMNVDTVQTMEWNSSRFSPDQGKGSAGVLDLRTEMGDNRWRFGGTNFIPGIGSQDGLHLDHWSPRAKLSGPIIKGKLWFHDAIDTFYTVSTVSNLPPGQDRAVSVSGSNLMRLQWNINRAHILTTSFLVNLANDSRSGLSVLSPAETTVNRRQSLYLGSIKDQWSLGGGLIEFGFADTSKFLQALPQGANAFVITPFGSRGNFFTRQSTATDRQEWIVNGFVKPLHLFGQHQIQIGSSVERSDIDQTIYRSEYTAVRADNSIVRDVQFLGSPRQFKSNLEAYGYLQDRWNPTGTLTLEAGLRTQWDEHSGGAPAAPRFAAAWAPAWAHGARFAGGWGIFYDSVTLNTLALSQEQDSITTFYAPDGSVIGGPLVSRFMLRPQDLRLPRFAITSFSADKRLPWQVFGKLSLISREGSRGFTFEQSLASPGLNLYVLDNIQRQRYRAASLELRRTFMAKYEWFASYTRSESRANAVIDYSVENPILTPQAGGPLPWDSPNRFLSWGWAPVERNWFPRFLQPVVGESSIQLLTDFRTGYPFTATNESGYLSGAPGSRRFPSYGSVNIALERKFGFHGYLWAWRVGLINALDRANPNVVNADVESPQFLTYARGQRRAVNVRLRFLGKK